MFGLNRNHYFGALMLALLSLGQLQRITLPIVSLYAHDVVALIWLLDLTALHRVFLFHKIGSLLKSNKHILFLLFGSVVWITLGWAWQWYTNAFSFWPLAYSLRISVYLSLAFALFQVNGSKKILSNHDIGYGLEVFYPILLFFGWIQYLFIPDTRWLATLGWDDHLGRMIGTQFDPNFLGLLFIFGSIWCTYQFQQTKHFRFFATNLLLVAAVVVTWSRSTYLVFLGIHSILIATWLFKAATFRSKNQQNSHEFTQALKLTVGSISLVGLLLLGILSTPKPTGEGGNLARVSTIQSRMQNTQSTLADLNGAEFIVGKGLFSISNDIHTQDFERPNHSKLPTSLPAFILSSIGYGGVGLLAVWSLFWCKSNTHIQQKLQSVCRKYPMFLLAILATFIHSFANASFTQPFVLLLLLSFLLLEGSAQKQGIVT